MSAMWDYQRMALGMLTDSVLDPRFGIKAPVSLQQEIKEITIGLVQEQL